MSTLCAIRYGSCQLFYHAVFGVMNYSLLMPNLVAFYAKLMMKYKNRISFCVGKCFQ